MLTRLAPALFVVLWSTGFIGSKLGAADAEPFTFLSIRFFLAILILAPIALLRGALAGPWRLRGHAAVVGALIHGGYLGGVFWAIRHGMPAGVAALIVSLQPAATCLLAGPLLGERLTGRQAAGVVLGLAGAVMIVAPKLSGAGGAASGVDPATVTAAVVGLLAITAGTLYQKRFVTRLDLVAGAVWQYLGALAVVGAGSLLLETRTVVWSPKFVFALAWLTFALSIGAILLLMLLIRQHAVSGVSGLFYLVPACTALMAWLIFGEVLGPVQLAGMAIAVAGVALIALGRAPGRPG